MNKGKKLGRGLEEVSHLFLSSPQTDPSNNTAPDLTYTGPVFSKTPLVFGIFCCLSIEVKSFFLANLSLEMAKCGRDVSVIDFGLTYPSVRYLMGNLVDLQDDFPSSNDYHLDFKIENIKLYGFSKITIFSLGVPLDQIRSKNIMKKIFADERIRESKIVLMNLPNGIILPEPFSHLQKSLFIIDPEIHSLVETYSLMKKLSPLCQEYLIGTIVQEGKDIFLSRQYIEKLQKTANNHINSDFRMLTTVDIPIDQEAIDSIKLRRPLSLVEQTSASGKALAKLCEHLLEIK